ncbi:hypothetical protein [Actinomadura sp. WMMA1423]|uniref:hypothetical protein n=1 Tax=Actinomadura sp. WMMA1423 TaxID=2591108 RepID=UPI00114789DB|nr:hypothetical protein [Actinomadura sp. WMMA1423]
MAGSEENMIRKELDRYSASEQREIARTRSSLEDWARRLKVVKDIAMSVADIVKLAKELLDWWNDRR